MSAGTVVLVGVLVTLLFVGAILRVQVVRIAIALFIAAMLALVAAMLACMRELMLALTGLEGRWRRSAIQAETDGMRDASVFDPDRSTP